MTASDGKMRLTDVADTEQLQRLIQSIPSPKAEPFKLWLARVSYERKSGRCVSTMENFKEIPETKKSKQLKVVTKPEE